ncbi:RCC1/BLIP-II protein [Exidia glandulosa HHB12029]|uniref:RCC1/BLIP-II protein n=1 Tax=Exidia glandulosa HHB12029 TaxID=1314781 RepID=A0A165JKR8_EXIGL|nr:RCC1/BLIP-II protein [Exidia glandulosa HHB12029]
MAPRASGAAPTRTSSRTKAAQAVKEEVAQKAQPKRKADDGSAPAAQAKRGRSKSTTATTNGSTANGHVRAAARSKPPPQDLNALPQPAEHLRPARHLFVFGNTDGNPQLGLGPDTTKVTRPRLHAWVKEAVESGLLGGPGAGFETVCVNGMHNLAVDELGRIWSWGINDEGQLGRRTSNVDDPARPGEKLDRDELESTPALVEELDPEVFRAVQVAAGGSVSVAVSDKGEVRSWGCFRWDGVFGFDTSATAPVRQFTPQSLPSLAGHRFASVACGQDHVLGLTTTGVIFAWGNGENGQLGRRIMDRRRKNALTAERLALRDIVYISAGGNSSFAVDKHGVLYAWGLNGYGQTGVAVEDGGSEAIVERPTVVRALHPEALNGRRVVQIASGSEHTLFLLSDGTLFGCGLNQDAQLGLPADHAALAASDSSMTVRTPVHIRLPDPPTESDPNPTVPPYSSADAAGPPSTPIVCVAASGRHNLVVSEAGHVYCWGWGAHAQLALGPNTEKQPVPTMIQNTALSSGWKILSAGAGSLHGVLVAVLPTDKAT